MSEMNQQPKSVKPKMPKIRFEGFSDDWNKNRLSSVFSIFSGNAFSSKDQAEEGIIWLKIADVGIQKMTPNNLSYLPFGYENTYEKYLIKKDDVVIALTRPILNKRLKIAIAGEKYHGALLNQRVGKIVSANNHVPFIYCLLQQEKLISQFESSIAGTDPPNLSLNEIKDIPLITPNQKEQTQIGNFFQELDKLIELQTRTVELAETHKKAMLQKMFPQKGEKVPKVRFEGFYDNWKVSSLGDIADIKTGKKDVQDALEDGIYPFYIRSDEVKKIDTYSFEGEAILIPGEGRLGEIFHYINGRFDYHQRVYKISNFKNINGLFVLSFMREHFKKHALTYTVKATVDSLRLPTIQTFLIQYPSLEEQTKLGHYFQELDRNIESEKQKLEQYQTMKRAMLQRMFV